MHDATTLDLERTEAFTNEEARHARRLELEEEALELHAEIAELVDRERQGRYELVVRLGRMRDDALWKHFGLYGSFEDYAVAAGAASCHTSARQMATLAKQLEALPLLHRLFQSGRVHWTKVREAARAATEKPEDEEHWADEIQTSSSDVCRRKAQLALGETPTRRSTLDLPLDVDALFEHYRDVVGQRLGLRITKAHAIELLVVSGLRLQAWPDDTTPSAAELAASLGVAVERPDDDDDDDDDAAETAPTPQAEPATEAAQAAPTPEVEPAPEAAPTIETAPETAEPATQASLAPAASKDTRSGSRIPSPAALLHLFECRSCGQVEIDSRVGPVPLELGRAATFAADAFVQDGEGNVSRTIPEKIRRRIFARDRGTCVVPGCGSRGFLDVHHEGPGGWRKVGHDEELLFLLCTGHHDLRHDGWLVIEGRVSTGLRFLDASGNELTGPQASTWWPTPPPSSPAAGPGEARDGAETSRTRAWDSIAVRDARLGLVGTGLKLAEADALLEIALAQLPEAATASELAAAAFRAMR